MNREGKIPYVRYLLKCLPDFRIFLEELAEPNDAFHEWCELYFLCRRAVHFWQRAEREDSACRLKEYADLQRALEEDLIDFLLDSKGNGAPG